jgi:hypothetical protein
MLIRISHYGSSNKQLQVFLKTLTRIDRVLAMAKVSVASRRAAAGSVLGHGVHAVIAPA